ncbi:hypothetical protein [Catellatospora tritici]|uniref:hypothetical protein n=1 Tax=Catellatospora tritici TaxID=2851566 RepID=UPI001C2D7A48|nr:hypothetical protein [Catellatospora tritici]MBV1854565.1 hypothetical protein [Catellatospora tritici]
MLNTLTLSERNTYSSANALTLPVAVIAVNVLAVTSGNVAMVLVVAAVAGLCLAGWSRLLYSLVYTANRWIGPLIGSATACLLLAAVTGSWPVLAGVALLLFVCWLPFMVAESAGQALRERAYWSQATYAWRLSQAAQIVIDIATIGATAVFLAVSADGKLPPVRLAASLILITPLLLSRAADRSGPPPAPYWPTPGGGWTPWPLPPSDDDKPQQK